MPIMKKLTVEPVGGLANRMRVIESSVALSKAYGVPLQINWLLNSSCNCPFSELFSLPDDIIVNEIKVSYFFNRILHYLTPIRIKLAGGCYVRQQNVEQLINSGFKLSQICKPNNMYITTCSKFYSNESRCLRPAFKLQNEIENICSNFNGHVVGVHIRRTDNASSIKFSPTSVFIDLMRNELNQNKDTLFFLATDDLEEEKLLLSMFSGKILTYKKRTFDRNKADAIQDALVDLFCLSRTEKIFGSYWSSFSEQAAFLGGCELIVVGNTVTD